VRDEDDPEAGHGDAIALRECRDRFRAECSAHLAVEPFRRVEVGESDRLAGDE
jgi:hypothetical protein